MITIFSSAGCPFAQRTRALLDHLELRALRRWLDRAAALPATRNTLPTREEVVERYRSRCVQPAAAAPGSTP